MKKCEAEVARCAALMLPFLSTEWQALCEIVRPLMDGPKRIRVAKKMVEWGWVELKLAANDRSGSSAIYIRSRLFKLRLTEMGLVKKNEVMAQRESLV
jgi:hypothetical protein